MKKINIIKKNEDFKTILDLKNYYRNPYFNIYIRNSGGNKNMYGIAVSKKIGNAVIRNKVKRQVKSIIDSKKSFKKSLDYIIIMKRSVLDIPFERLEKELLNLLDRIDNTEEKHEK